MKEIKVYTKQLSDFESSPVEWIWPLWIPQGALSIFAGIGGQGKTTIVCDLCARITRGDAWPDGGAASEAGEVLFYTVEDAIEQVIKPRFAAAGADMTKVHVVEGVGYEKGDLIGFDPIRHVECLLQKLDELNNLKVIVIDPISILVGGDLNKANDVRLFLKPILDYCVARDVAFLGITHLSKNSKELTAKDRVLGSSAFTDLARSVVIADFDDKANSSFVSIIKSNYASLNQTIYYQIQSQRFVFDSGDEGDVAVVVWGKHIQKSLQQLHSSASKSKQDFARELIESLFEDSDRLLTRDVLQLLYSKGLNKNAIDRAARALEIERNGAYWHFKKSEPN